MSYGCKCNCENFREHALGVNVASSATPSRGGGQEAQQVNAREKRWSSDMPAYRRLRQEGLQPKRIDGCAALERDASDKTEITDGQVYGNKLGLVKDYKEAVHETNKKAVGQ